MNRGAFMTQRLFKIALAATAMIAAAPALASTTIANADSGADVASFGRPDSQTYGQVFRAPVSGVLSSFTFWLNGTVEGVSGGVGTWNDADLSYNTGNGSPTNLFLSSPFTASGATSVSPGIGVTAGQLYVAYLTVFGNAGPSGTVSFDRGTPNADLGYFVWNNGTNPVGNSSWNYFSNLGNARFSATFNAQAAVPEPSTWALMILGFGLMGYGLRRRQKVNTTVSYA